MKKLFVVLSVLFALGQTAQACPTGLRPFNKDLGGKKTCVLEDTYVGSLVLTNSFNYILLGPVFIGQEKRDANLKLIGAIQGADLVINPGVTVYALNPSKDVSGVWTGMTTKAGTPVKGDIKSFLSVTRDSTIQIKGTEAAPVLFTSAQGEAGTAGDKQPGDWGGLVISGKAKSNKCTTFAGCTLPGEANTGFYGGDDDFHSSGVIQYLQVEYGGDRVDAKKELNGVTFNTVGLGTVIENLAVLYNSDDCVEWFGGASTGKNIFCYKGEDDGIDTTDGARIFLQNGIVVAGEFDAAGAKNDRHMVEADSSKNDDANKRLRSHPVLVNFTFVGTKNSQGLKIRRGTKYTLVNSVMTGVDTWCLNPEGSYVEPTTGESGVLFSTNTFADCKGTDPIDKIKEFAEPADFVTASFLNLNKWVPQAGSPLL
ncbi:MAG: hypothetical protein AAF203_03200, partial [Pseudomonadota bacterium]